MKNPWLVALSLIMLFSCENALFQKSYDLEDRSWQQQDIKVFDFEIEESTEVYGLFLNLRNTADYTYNNIFIDFSLIGDDGVLVENRTVEQLLFDAKSGTPLGQSGIGDVFSHQIYLMDTVFPKPGNYRLSIRHYMRTESLNDVVSVGASIIQKE